MRGTKIVLLYYWEDANVFVDRHGRIVHDIYKMLTPNDLFLFRQDEGFNCFSMKNKKGILVEIISMPEEVCGI